MHHEDNVLLESKVEVRYWTLHFNASESQIRKAVLAVGSHPARVGAWLKEMGRIDVGGPQHRAGGAIASLLRNCAFLAIGAFSAAALLP